MWFPLMHLTASATFVTRSLCFFTMRLRASACLQGEQHLDHLATQGDEMSQNFRTQSGLFVSFSYAIDSLWFTFCYSNVLVSCSVVSGGSSALGFFSTMVPVSVSSTEWVAAMRRLASVTDDEWYMSCSGIRWYKYSDYKCITTV